MAGLRNCEAGNNGSYTYAIGQPNPGKTIEDGKGGVSVSCTVKADGNFSASIGGVDENTYGRPLSATFTGVYSMTPTNNPATMTFFSPEAGHLNTLVGLPSCQLSNVSVYKKGAMLADIDCPIIGDDTNTNSGCSVHATFAFEYCKTGEEQD